MAIIRLPFTLKLCISVFRFIACENFYDHITILSTAKFMLAAPEQIWDNKMSNSQWLVCANAYAGLCWRTHSFAPRFLLTIGRPHVVALRYTRRDLLRLRKKVLALGLCASCYHLKRQDEEYFGGLHGQVLERDEHCCRACGASDRRPSSGPGRSLLHLMISLCTKPACRLCRSSSAASSTERPRADSAGFQSARVAAQKVPLFAEAGEGN
jgi:hypothetical protein